MVGDTASINDLPPELLAHCFRYAIAAERADARTDGQRAAHDCCGYWPSRYDTARALCLTSKPFHEVAQLLLYEDINITTPCSYDDYIQGVELDSIRDRDLRVQSDLLCDTIDENPGLRRMVKSLAAGSDVYARLVKPRSTGDGEFEFPYLSTLALQEMPSVDDLCEENDNKYERGKWNDCEERLKRLPNLSELYLSAGSLAFGNLNKILQISSLRRLTLSNVSCPEPYAMMEVDEDEDLDDWTKSIRAASDRAALPPSGFEGTSTITELNLLSPFEMSPWALRNFLCWPKTLEKLTIGVMGTGDYSTADLVRYEGQMSYHWTFGVISEALEHQRNSLRELRIHPIGSLDGLSTFDIHGFTALELLQVPAPRKGTLKAIDAARMWLTPKLRKLVLQYMHVDSQGGGHLWTFRTEDLDWLDGFARAAAERKQDGILGLEEIEILFEPDNDYGRKNMWNSRHMFKTIQGMVETHGFKLAYPTNIPEPPSV